MRCIVAGGVLLLLVGGVQAEAPPPPGCAHVKYSPGLVKCWDGNVYSVSDLARKAQAAQRAEERRRSIRELGEASRRDGGVPQTQNCYIVGTQVQCY